MDAPIDASAVLVGAAALLREGWCQGADARDAADQPVPGWDEDAASWSVLGALLGSQGRGARTAQQVPVEALAGAAAGVGVATDAYSLKTWNDAEGRTHADVLAALDRAILLVALPDEDFGGRLAGAAAQN
jgi:hypothetical protein